MKNANLALGGDGSHSMRQIKRDQVSQHVTSFLVVSAVLNLHCTATDLYCTKYYI